MPVENINDPYYHVGHHILNCMRRRRPDDIYQIDAATGEQKTYSSVLNRFIRLARSLRVLGFKPGDVLALGGKNHNDIHIPYYAALMNGLPIAGVDSYFTFDEMKELFELTRPKIAFCDREQYDLHVKVIDSLNLDTTVITFSGEHSMSNLISSYDIDEPIEEFEPATFDLDKVYAWLLSSARTSGILKIAATKHKELIRKQLSLTVTVFEHEVKERRNIRLNLSPVQWISGYFCAFGAPLVNHIKLQTSALMTPEHIIDIINKYKPIETIVTSALVTALLRHPKKCDFTCFDSIFVTGGKVYKDLLIELRQIVREDAEVIEIYGQTENMGPIFKPNPRGPLGNCGQKIDSVMVKIMDLETGNEIKEPFVEGELWTKGPMFTEYYNDPAKTALAFAEDGWYKTGDIMYRDEEYNFYFVDRINMLILYKHYRIPPQELEEVIRTHEGVYDVAVTASIDPIDMELPVACVVKQKESNVTAQDIKDLVASKLSDFKQLRGGVVFLDRLPMTSAGKVARAQLRQIVLEAEKIF